MSILALSLAILALIFSFFACYFCIRYSAASVSMRKLSKMQAEMTDFADSLTSLHEMLTRLRSRIGMRELRKRRKNGATGQSADEDVDLTTEAGRTIARQRLEAELAASGRLNSRTHRKG
jgi:hypothetical protein